MPFRLARCARSTAMSRMTMLSLALALACVAPPLATAQDADAEATPIKAAPQEPHVTRIFSLKHAAVNDVIVMLRSIVEVRHVFQEEELGLVIVRGTETQMEEAERLVTRLDVAVPRWSIEVVASGPEGAQVVRLRDVSRTALSFQTKRGPNMLSLSIDATSVAADELEFVYSFSAKLGTQKVDRNYSESGSATMGPDEMLILFEPSEDTSSPDHPGSRALLGRLLDLPGPVHALGLRVRRSAE